MLLLRFISKWTGSNRCLNPIGVVVYRAGLANNVRLPCLREYGGGNAIGVVLSLKIMGYDKILSIKSTYKYIFLKL